MNNKLFSEGCKRNLFDKLCDTILFIFVVKMATARKLERLKLSLKNVETFCLNINSTTRSNSILTNLEMLDSIKDDTSEVLDNSNLEPAVIAEYWQTVEEFYRRLKPVLLDARDKRRPQIAQSSDKDTDLKDSIAAVLDSQKSFFDTFGNTTLVDRTNHHNNSHDIKVPRLNIHSFSGGDDDYKKWPPFYNMYKVSVHDNENISTVHKFQLLNTFVKGEAFDLISHLLVTEENYQIAWDKLCARYNKQQHIANSYIKQFLNVPNVTSINNKTLRHFTDLADEMLRGLDALGNEFQTRDPWLIFILLSKLDDDTKQKWADISSENNNNTIVQFIDFLNKRCNAIESCQIHSKSSSSKPKSSTKAFVTNTSSKSLKCPNCNESHLLFKCIKFISLDNDARRKLVADLNLCFNCLKPNHTTIKCFSHGVCQMCKRKHHTLLHQSHAGPPQANNISNPSAHVSINSTTLEQNQINDANINHTIPQNINAIQPSTQTQNSSNSISNQGSTQCFLSEKNGQCLLPTVQAYAQDSSGRFQMVRALLDSASMCSFVTENCVQKLGLQRTHACLSISGLSCQKAGTTRGQVEIELYSRHDKSSPITLDALIMNKITTNLPQLSFDISSWSNLKGLSLADPTFNKSTKIDILIGVQQFYKIQCPEPIIHITSNTIAQKTQFGWVVAGYSSLNEIQTSLPTVTRDDNDDLHELLHNFWKLEEVPNTTFKTLDETFAEIHYNQNTVLLEDGKYCVKLPFKLNHTRLGNSKSAALRRLYSMEHKFKRNPEYQADYAEFMREYMRLEHMEEVPFCEIDEPAETSFYLPHHAVIRESSTSTRTRVVFDGSCKTTSGVSLNDCLVVGPTIQRSLATILLNFRTYKVAFASDIQKMYRQIWVAPEDRNYQRIFWRENITDPVKTFRLKTVTYGTTSAPFLAIKTLMKIAEDDQNMSSDTKLRVKNDFYVDDLLSGCQSLEHAINVKNELVSALESHGMPLRKWISNNTGFLESLPSQHVQTHTNLELNDQCEMPSVKTLGLNWNPNSDEFFFNVNVSEQQCSTKRQISSLAAKLFDPLGWVSPATVSIKIFLQALWIKKFGWDDELTDVILNEWNKLYQQLFMLSKVRLPRCLNLFDGVQNHIQVHGFSDASESAYGAAIYIRVSRSNEVKTVNLATSKSKVAPLKQVSLARLELCAALLLSNLMQWVLNVLNQANCNNVQIFGWTDSTIVLSWLSEFPRKWCNFVANRTSKIIEILPRHNWRHVKSDSNPADIVSRGINPTDLVENQLWWHGPKWLMQAEKDWPEEIPLAKVSNSQLEMKSNTKLTLHTNTHTNIHFFKTLFEKFSSLQKILKSICFFDRFLLYLRKFESFTPFISFKNLQTAENHCIRWAQNESFSDDKRALLAERRRLSQITDMSNSIRAGNCLSPKSKLISFTPFLDEDNIIRIGGRLNNAEIPFSAKHPILLPSNHIFSIRLVEQYHERYLHTGTATLISIIRQKFWIIGVRSLVKKVARKCLKCIKIKARTTTQLMGQLPIERLTPSRPFLHTGVDYAGPLQIRATTGRGRIQVSKGYIAIFICYTSKALHLELVSSMTTEAFIATMKRFTSRRGTPAVVHCDNGSNFVGAEKDLRKSQHQFIQFYNNKQLIDFASEKQMEFKFNPPSGPHFGALWESNIKSVKTHLKRITGNSLLTFEEITTLLVQIEGLLNSRPMFAISDDVNDLNFLTPSHFLIGTNLTALPEPNYEHLKESYLSRWQNIQKRIQGFWKIWSKEYITSLQQKPKWQHVSNNMQIGDLVLIQEDNMPSSRWAMGRVIKLHPGKDGLVRVVTLKTQGGELDRPIVKLVKLTIA